MGFMELELREGVKKMGGKLGHFPFGVNPRPYPLKWNFFPFSFLKKNTFNTKKA